MSRTIRKNCPKLIKSIHRNRQRDAAGLWAWGTNKDDAILRGQDGAIRYDKCQTANVDNEGGYKLNNHDYIYSKNRVTEPARKQRQAGKHLISRQLEG